MTRDQRWLLKVTQKPKFRWLKVLTQRVRNITSVINYHWCIILNKLHLLDRITFVNEDERFVFIVDEGLDLQCFSVAQCGFPANLYVQDFSDVDYFTTKKRDKIVHEVKNIRQFTYIMRLTLKNVALVLGDKVYQAPLPEIRATFHQVDLTQRPRHCGVSVVPEYRTVTYDLSKLRNMTCAAVVSDPNNHEEIQYVYNELCEKMSEALSKLSLSDLEVKN